MVRVVLGRAGAGKTAFAVADFRDRMARGQKGLYFIVPEQYSHDAERLLLKACGDRLSLHGEVLSFSRLCSRVFAELGGAPVKAVDDGARILIMHRAFDAAAGNLSAFRRAENLPDFLERLVRFSKELKSARLSPDDLEAAALRASGPLGGKLRDLALILRAYGAFFAGEASDPDGRLDRLAEIMPRSAMFDGGHVYLDGFTDFTAQQMRVVEALVGKRVPLTVCLTCDGLDGSEEIFDLPRKTALEILRLAQKHGAKAEVVVPEGFSNPRAPELSHLERALFSDEAPAFQGEGGAVEVFRAPTMAAECEYAASRALELARSGYRWRDIAVAVSDFKAYGSLAENIFEKYGVPVYISRKADISLKPPVALIEAALRVATSGWEYSAVFAYLKTGLAGVPPRDCDELENYVLTWNLRGDIWAREEDWTFPALGDAPDYAGDGEERLSRINAVRRTVARPLKKLKTELGGSPVFGDKLKALYAFLLEIGLPDRICEKARSLRESGDLQLSDEYRQLWEIIVRAMDQFNDFLGDATGTDDEFARLFSLLLSQYDVGTIPVWLDRVSLGELSRQRRRDTRCLILLGASDDMLSPPAGDSLLSEDERGELSRLGLPLPGTTEERIGRHLALLYSTLTLPSERLVVTYPERGATGGDKRPSFVVRRLKALFPGVERSCAEPIWRLSAPKPCLELAASFRSRPESAAAAAALLCMSEDRERSSLLARIEAAAARGRGSLTEELTSRLYGERLVLSASRVEKYSMCPYQYFLQYGLTARPRKKAGLDAPSAGSFVHRVLEEVAREAKSRGGFSLISDDVCLELARSSADRYAAEVLDNFKDRSGRFKYLFGRLKKDAAYIALDMAQELKDSDFTPLDFELEFSDGGDIPPHSVKSGSAEVKIKGVVDRLDGWIRDGRLYVRVVDYKTGRKKFSLSDVVHGLNTQMLIYLFALEESGPKRYGLAVVPAGVLYAPARDRAIPAPRHADDETVSALRSKALRRSGLILSDPEVVSAMERSEIKRYLPVRSSKDSGFSGESLARPEQMRLLKRHVENMLLSIAENMLRGHIDARPYYKSDSDNACAFCDYRAACCFSEDFGDLRRYLRKLPADEAWRRIGWEEAGQ